MCINLLYVSLNGLCWLKSALGRLEMIRWKWSGDIKLSTRSRYYISWPSLLFSSIFTSRRNWYGDNGGCDNDEVDSSGSGRISIFSFGYDALHLFSSVLKMITANERATFHPFVHIFIRPFTSVVDCMLPLQIGISVFVCRLPSEMLMYFGSRNCMTKKNEIPQRDAIRFSTWWWLTRFAVCRIYVAHLHHSRL